MKLVAATVVAGLLLTACSHQSVPSVVVGSDQWFTSVLKSRPRDYDATLTHTNHTKRLINVESFALIGKKEFRLGGSTTFQATAGIGFSEFGNTDWRRTLPFEHYIVRVTERDPQTGRELPQLTDLTFTPAELSRLSQKGIHVDFFGDRAVVTKDGVKSDYPYDHQFSTKSESSRVSSP